MQTKEQQNQQIFEEAAALVASVRRELDAAAGVLGGLGVDKEKVAAVVATQIAPEQVAEAEAAFRADMDAVQREIDEEMARRSFQRAPAGGAPRPRRSMI